MSAAEPALFAAGAEAQWVGDWLSSRQVRQEKKSDNAVAVATQARQREEKREDKIDAGMREPQTWLHDLAREGLAAVRSRGQGMWDGIAARMADAQARRSYAGFVAPIVSCTSLARATATAWWPTNSPRSTC